MTEPVLPPFKSIRYAGRGHGPRLIVTGAVHGNETCGTRAIERLAAELDAGAVSLTAGALTLVPVANPLAYQRGRREGERNLNRALAPSPSPREFEDHVANWLCPLLAAHDGLLDLHSFQAGGDPFVMVGPEDNAGPIEPFGQAATEAALARRLGVRRAVHGWLGTYARGVARRHDAAGHWHHGVGTTEYMRSTGGWALTLECGQHADPQAPEVAYRAILSTLAHLGLVDAPAPPPQALEALELWEVVDKLDAADRFARDWRSFDALAAGQLIGTRADGTPVRMPVDGRIVFPNAAAQAGHEWFYLARPSTRGALAA